jgi:predicted Fe-Mo cluster-binding NifX family protein
VIAIAVDDADGVESAVASHYGRCPFYLVAVTTGQEVQATRIVPNPFAWGDEPGDMLGFLRSTGADVVIVGSVGLGATNRLERFDIEEVTGASGRARDALAAYLAGRGAVPGAGVVRLARVRSAHPPR